MTFRVGMRVVCVSPQRGFLGLNGSRWDGVLTKGEVYVVRWAGSYTYFGTEYPGVRLVGIERDDIDDTPFHAKRFRPIVERKTSIEIFTQMLTPHGVDA